MEKGKFPPDTNIKGVKVVESPNGKQRLRPLSRIVITVSGTETSGEALLPHTEGPTSIHYLIDQQGGITQLLKESEQANTFPQCKECNEGSVVISLVNTGIIGQPEGGNCPEGIQATQENWCARLSEFTCTDQTAYCWSPFTQEQILAMKYLVVDIAQRHNIDPTQETLQLAEQILESTKPGPAIAESKTPYAWYTDLISETLRLKNTEGFKPGEQGKGGEVINQYQERTSISVTLPTTARYITSCFGERFIDGKPDYHDGLDFGMDKLPVNTIADGTVYQACEDCAGLGKTIVIRHAPNLYSRYSHLSEILVAQGDTVARGQQIAVSGNTGRSSGPHLDLKIYTSEADVSRAETGKNPLCFFTEEQLQRLERGSNADSCIDFTTNNKFTHANERLQQDCAGIDPLSSAPSCALNVEVDETTEERLTAAKDNLANTPGAMAAIQQAAAQTDVDDKLLIALIAQESLGDQFALNSGGHAGLGQLSFDACQDWKDILDTCNQDCKCKSPGSCDGQLVAECNGDGRFNTRRNIVASAHHLERNFNYFSGAQDKTRLALAAYNAGQGHLLNASDDAKAALQTEDPSWEQTKPFLEKYVSASKYTEVTNYVASIMSMYTQQGGRANVVCEELQGSVKTFGTYEFAPSFTTKVTDVLSYVDTAVAFAQDVYTSCDGETDTRTCIEQKKSSFSSSSVGITACEEPPQTALLSVQQFIDDCRNNKQDNCLCSGTVDMPIEESLIIRQDGTVVYGAYEEPTNPLTAWPRYWGTPYAATPDDPTELRSLQIYMSGDQENIVWTTTEPDPLARHILEYVPSVQNVADGQDPQLVPKNVGRRTPKLSLMKREGELVWIEDPQDTPFCGVYKTQHHACMLVKEPIMVNGISQNPTIKFALHLNDEHPPEPVDESRVCADQQSTEINVIFPPSTSDDISYYKVGCELKGSTTINDSVTVLGREDDRPITTSLSATLETCRGTTIFPLLNQPIEVIITPYDISGNAGEPVTVVPEKEDDKTDLWLSLASGGLTTEELMYEYYEQSGTTCGTGH